MPTPTPIRPVGSIDRWHGCGDAHDLRTVPIYGCGPVHSGASPPITKGPARHMSRPATSTRRPVLLLLVYGAVLILVGITASAQAMLVSSHFSSTALGAILDSDATTVRTLVNQELRPSDLDPATVTASRAAELEQILGWLTERDALVRAELRTADGRIIASNVPGLTGTVVAMDAGMIKAAAGKPEAALHDGSAAGSGPGGLEAEAVLREDLPLTLADRSVPAILVVWRDAGPILAELDGVRRDVVLVTLLAAVIAGVILTIIFRSAQGRLARQGAALVEASRTDALTRLPNHGALVEALGRRIDEARQGGGSVGVAMIDFDNFKLLNDIHGHEVGDEALMALAELVKRHLPDGAIGGRFGPDEFLVVGVAGRVEDLAPAIEAIRVSLRDLVVQVPDHEKLPMTVSAAIARHPDDGDSANLVLASLVATLEGAAASGGDQVVIAGGPEDGRARTSAFNVYEGLVFAIDTKDRYTKRHSEDVARYAIFLGQQLGLNDRLLETIRTAGLLHDVGKIGIPDEILRKPSRLTAEEADAVKHHVALGDMIVRDLPGIDDIRAAVRHHHERWDGKGYLEALAGDNIPVIARIISVADVFSAMTTSRPYRKALELPEAIARLGDAAGTQLDERLVRIFLDGLERAADAPLPGADRAPLWSPRTQVA